MSESKEIKKDENDANELKSLRKTEILNKMRNYTSTTSLRTTREHKLIALKEVLKYLVPNIDFVIDHPKFARMLYNVIEDSQSFLESNGEQRDDSLTMYKESIFGNRNRNDLDNLIDNKWS